MEELFERMWKNNHQPPNGTTLKKAAKYYFEKGLKANKDDGAEVPCNVGLDAPVVDEEMLIRAMRKAVDVGLIPKWADEELYLKNWDGMKKVLQAAVGN
jgi:hypothetical protein